MNASDFETPASSEISLSEGMPTPKMGVKRLVIVVLAHIVFLAVAAKIIVSVREQQKKEELVFVTERPSATANKRPGEDAAKLSKMRSMGGAPPNAKRLTSASSLSSIAIPAVAASSITDFVPGRMGGGMGSGLGGFGTGGGLGSGGGGMGLGGGGGRIKFFGFEGDATSVILAIDVSGSMERNVGGPAGIQKLRDEIKRTINSLSPVSLFNIICFAGDADCCFPVNVRATAENKERALKFLQGYYGDGGFGRTRTEKLRSQGKPLGEMVEYDGVQFTPLQVNQVKGLEGTSGGSRMDLALVAAMERGASTIFLLSDGQPTAIRNGVPLKQEELIDLVEENYKRLYSGKGRKEVVINTIYTNTDRSEEEFMKKISRKFRGKHKDVKLN